MKCDVFSYYKNIFLSQNSMSFLLLVHVHFYTIKISQEKKKTSKIKIDFLYQNWILFEKKKEEEEKREQKVKIYWIEAYTKESFVLFLFRLSDEIYFSNFNQKEIFVS